MARTPMTRESRLAAQRKYNRSPKGRAAAARYATKRKPADKRYRASAGAKEKGRLRMRKWRALNPEKARERRIESLRKWRAKNREAYRIHCRKRRDLECGAEGWHFASDIKALFVEQGGFCVCGVYLGFKYHVDHKTPLSRGGTNWPENLQLLCPSCNHSKRDKTMTEWAQSRLMTC